MKTELSTLSLLAFIPPCSVFWRYGIYHDAGRNFKAAQGADHIASIYFHNTALVGGKRVFNKIIVVYSKFVEFM